MSAAEGQVAAMKAEAVTLQTLIARAPSKDEALELAVQAAELCMKALKIATDREQKSEIRSRCQTLLDEAERIKTVTRWPLTPAVTPSLASSPVTSPLRLHPETEAAGPPSAARVKQLTEPTPSRELLKAEQIILLKSSKLNGFIFPPWQGPPDPDEFVLGDEDEAFRDMPHLGLSVSQTEFFNGWERAHDAIPPPTWFPGERREMGPTMYSRRPVDLVQDVASDCSVVASLCAWTARAERGNPRILAKVIYPYDSEKLAPKISPNGKYIVRLNFNGCYRKVVIDDRLPTSKNMRVLHVIDRRNPSLLWPVLLEKAYLKVRGGYDFPGSHSGTDLWILTGWIPEQIWLENDTDPDQLWSRILNAFNKGDVLITLGTGRMSHRVERQLGLEGEHDYAVLNMKEEGSSRQLCLKNPWCEGTSWRGKVPDPSTSEKSESDFEIGTFGSSQPGNQASNRRSSLGSVCHMQEQGIFWIDLNNVLRHFQSLFLNWNPGLFSYRQDCHFGWDLSSRLDSVTCFANHPQFKVVAKGGSIVWLLLSRHLKDKVEGAQELPLTPLDKEGSESRVAKEDLAGYISIFAFDRKGTRVYLRDGSLERAPYVDSPQILLRLQPDVDITYSVVVDEEDMSSTAHSFTLSAFSTSPVALDKADSPYSCQRLLGSTWTQATAGGNANDPTYSQNPQFSLRVLEHTPAAVLIQTPSNDIHVHVKLVHGRGQRVYTLTSKDVIADSGPHRRGSAVIEIDELYPGTYTLICSTFKAGQQANFSLRVDSARECELRQLPGEDAGRIKLKLADACFGNSVSKIAAPLIPRRFVCITVVAKFVSGMAFSSHDLMSFDEVQAGTRSPLRITIELGTGPNRRVLDASSDGEYSDAVSGIRTDDVDLSPQMLYTGDIWLVLDRLCGPASGGQETYSVEVLCDQPKSLDVGRWRSWDY